MQEIEYVHEDEVDLGASADEEEDMEDMEDSGGTSSSGTDQDEGLAGTAAGPTFRRREPPTKRKAGRPKKSCRRSISNLTSYQRLQDSSTLLEAL